MSKLARQAPQRHRLLLGVALALVLVLAVPQPAFASVSSTPENAAQTNGTVFDMVQMGDLTIIVGSFSRVAGLVRETIAAIRPDGTVDPNFRPRTDGKVHAVALAADGSRIFIGGTFSTVNGVPRAKLAALTPTGALDLGWAADLTGESAPFVRSLAVHGPHLYVGGRYTRIEGKTRKNLAKVDTATSDVVIAFSPRPDKIVWEVVVSPDGQRVYAVGEFTKIAGIPRPNSIAEIDAATGAPTAWNPEWWPDRVVTVALDPTGTRVYVANEDNYVVAYYLPSNKYAWRINTSGNTQAIAVTETEIYFGGHWERTNVFGVSRSYLASLTHDGRYTSWNPYLSGLVSGVWAILLTPTRLSVGGHFNKVGSTTRKYFARFPGTP